MDAEPISVNAAAGGNGSSGVSAATAKASTLPAFAQVMAEKQAAVSAPKETATASGAEQARAASGTADAVRQKSSDRAPADANGQAGGAADSPKKGSAKGKSSADASAAKTAVQVAAQVPVQAAAQIPGILPGLNGTMPWVTTADPGNAAPQEMATTSSGGANIGQAAVTAANAAGAKAETTNTATTSVATVGQQRTVTGNLASPNAADSQNLPVSVAVPQAIPTTESASNATSAPATAPTSSATPLVATPTAATSATEGQKNAQATGLVEAPNSASVMTAANVADAAAVVDQSLPVAGNDLAAPNAAMNAGNATGNQATPVASGAKPGDLSAATVATAATLPVAIAEGGATNMQTTPKNQGKRGAQEILRGAAALAGKEAQAVARVSANAAKDFVGAIKGKSGANDTGAPIASQPAANGKNEATANVKAEAVTPEVAQAPANPGSVKSESNVRGNSSLEESSSGNSSGSAGAAANGKDSAAGGDSNGVHGVIPAGQNVPLNLAAGAANAVAAQSGTIGKDSESAMPAKAGDASNNAAPTTADADDAAQQPTESRVVNVAQLAGDQGHSQVRIAMQTDQLGQVELHATVHGEQVGAAITVEKKEAHAAMAAEMPSLQQALQDQQLRMGEVVLVQGAIHSTAGDAGNAAAEQQRRGQAGSTYQQAENETTYEAGVGANFEGSGIFDDSGRLSVRA